MDANNDADSLIFQTENAMKEAGDKLDPADKSEVENDLSALKETLKNIGEGNTPTDAQLDEIKNGKEKLMNSAQKLFAKMYEQTQQGAAQGPDMGGAAGAGPDMGAAGSGNDDDVVDADFKEV